MVEKQEGYCQEFIRYQRDMIRHPNYQGLPIRLRADGTYVWHASKKTDIGKARISWCEQKAVELNEKSGGRKTFDSWSDVMREVHPTKWRPCPFCGKVMCIYYVYPNMPFLRKIQERFGAEYTECNHILEIWNDLERRGVPDTDIAEFLIKQGELRLPVSAPRETIVGALEYACRKGSKGCLGPGSMSNFPDRFDGFHYNRCCRKSHDKGRSDENMRSYGKDRRAYEYWSDGNIHAANEFMHSWYFAGASADHVGPISLGFVHDPRYLQRMEGSENSTKRDHLRVEDIDKMIAIEQRTGICAISWYSELLWEHIRTHYREEPWKVDTCYRDALKQNMANYMYILRSILEASPTNGGAFLQDTFLRPHFEEFAHTYAFNEQGDIIACSPRHITESSQNEMERYCRIAFDSVFEYAEKENRNMAPKLSETQMGELCYLCLCIQRKEDITVLTTHLAALVNEIQADLIKTM